MEAASHCNGLRRDSGLNQCLSGYQAGRTALCAMSSTVKLEGCSNMLFSPSLQTQKLNHCKRYTKDLPRPTVYQACVNAFQMGIHDACAALSIQSSSPTESASAEVQVMVEEVPPMVIPKEKKEEDIPILEDEHPVPVPTSQEAAVVDDHTAPLDVDPSSVDAPASPQTLEPLPLAEVVALTDYSEEEVAPSELEEVVPLQEEDITLSPAVGLSPENPVEVESVLDASGGEGEDGARLS